MRTVFALFLVLLVGSSLTYAAWSGALVLRGPDAGMMIYGRPVQFGYVHCLFDSSAIWFEDGSAICGGTHE